MYSDYCPICKCLLAGLPLETAVKLCEVSKQYPFPSVDSLIRVVQGPTAHPNLNELLNEARLEMAFGRFIISLAEELKLDIFVKWLSRKLEKLSNLKVNLLAFAVVIAILSILLMVDKLTR